MSLKNNIEDAYPLSPTQQGMLFHTLYAPQAGMYVEQLSCTLHGDLDSAAFKQAWQHVVDRHPILRSAFAWRNLERPLQVVGRRVGLPLAQHDWRELAPEEQQVRLEALLRADRERGFDLATAPLLRLTLCRLADDAHAFVLSHHHLLLDGWSLPLVLNEVLACYAAFAYGRPLVLPTPRPYRDYIAWLQRQDLAHAEAFWRQYLQGVTAPTPFAIDRPAAADPVSYAIQRRRLSPAATDALDSFAREHGLTLNTLVQGAWALLLSHYSGETDVVFGATVAGRPPELPGSEQMIGLFINTLPVRARVPDAAPVAAWLRQLQTEQVELRQYEHSPLVQIQGWSAVPRGTPLFESILVFENQPGGETIGVPQGRDQLAVSQVRSAEPQTNYPLTIVVVPSFDLLFEASYDRGRFDDVAIVRMLGHLETLLAGIATDPGRRISALSPLTDGEHRQLVHAWNVTQADVPSSQCIHQLVAAQAARTPDAVALVFEDQQLTYAALDARANQLAHDLQARGVGPDALVAVCLERSLELIVALLGVLKAGGAYLPLDPAYPKERLAFMLEDSQAPVLITTQEQRTKNHPEGTRQKTDSTTDRKGVLHTPPADDVGAYSTTPPADDVGAYSTTPPADDTRAHDTTSQPTVVDLIADWEQIARQPETNLDSDVTPEHLAYVIYTSGSSGAPKGAMAHHYGLVNFAVALAGQIGLQPGERFLQFASFSFDASALQVFPTLISGAVLVLHRNPASLANHELLALCVRQRVTVLDLPGSFWQQWIADLAAQGGHLPDAVRVCMTGGESISPDQLRTWAGLARRSVRFLSSYGPTEATVTTTLFGTASDEVEALHIASVPLGARLPNTQVYVLDRHMRPVPIDIPGEVYIGGAGVVRGYLNRPDLTAERFVPNPFTGERLGIGDWRFGSADATISNLQSPISNRLYRTGDLARYRSNGTLEFLGRVDQQVKLRGFRIEPGEIEAALRRHGAVREAAVVVREDAPGDKRLVAYIVMREWRMENGDSASDNLQSPFSILQKELRDFLKERLPDYMVPAAFVMLDALPLTPNGKLDRRALPAPDWSAEGARSLIMPRDNLELQLVRMWEEVLDVHPIGVTDNFFERGGHSLAAVALVAQIHKRFKHDLPLATLFQVPTVEQMAGLLRGQAGSLQYSPLVRIQPAGARRPLFLVHPAGGNVLCFGRLAQLLGPDQPSYGLQARGLDAGQQPLAQIEEMAALYIEAMRTVQAHGPYCLAGWSMGGLVAFEIAQQLRRQGDEVALLALFDTGAPLAAADPPNDAHLLADVIGMERLPLPFEDFECLDRDEQLRLTLEALKRSNLLPPDADLPHARRLLEVFKASVTAVAHYAPQVYPDQITLFRTAPEQPDEPQSDDPTMGWSQLAVQPIEVYPIPGTHSTLLFEPHVRVLAEQLRACLETLRLRSLTFV